MNKNYVKIFLPPQNDLKDFYSFMDYCAYYGVTDVIIETSGAFEYKKHTEINAGWIEYTKNFSFKSGESVKAQYANGFPKNAIHWENGGGEVLSQETVKDIIKYIRHKGMNAIPEVQSLTHCDWLLYNHRELAERSEDKYPDHYCPSNEQTYALLFDIIDEVISVFCPDFIHIGHDELYTVGICEKCKGKDAKDLYLNDILKIYHYIKSKNIGVMMWADKLLKSQDKTGVNYGGNKLTMAYEKEKGGHIVTVPPVYETIYQLPKDIILFHWHYIFGEQSDDFLISNGFKIVYANIRPMQMCNINSRLANNNVVGTCVSHWGKVQPNLLQRNGTLFDIAYLYYFRQGQIILGESECTLSVINKMFENNNSKILAKKHIEIIHNCDIMINHCDFVDGNYMEYEKDFLGSYEFEFKNGEKKSLNIYYGLNIGYSGNNFAFYANKNFYINEYMPHILESTFTTTYIYENNQMYYKIVFDSSNFSDLVSTHFVGSNVNVKSVAEVLL